MLNTCIVLYYGGYVQIITGQNLHIKFDAQLNILLIIICIVAL